MADITCNNLGVLTFPTVDFNRTMSSTIFNVAYPGGKVKIGGSEHTVTEAEVTSLIELWKPFYKGTNTTNADGASLGLGMQPKITYKAWDPIGMGVGTTPSSAAQREIKLVLVLEDTKNFRKFVHEVPCVNLNVYTNNNNSLPQNLVTAIENFLKGPSVSGLPGGATNLPMIFSPYGNPLKYITSYLQGKRYKNNN